MTTLVYLALLAVTLAFAGVSDWAWLRYVRPRLAQSRGWPDVQSDESIAWDKWCGAWLVIAVICAAYRVALWIGSSS